MHVTTRVVSLWLQDITLADFRVTAGTPFYSWIYTLKSCDLDTFWSLDTSGANDQPINLNTMAWNHLSKK